uniref:VWFA domain-containing protein n=1 Tax=Pyrodinium bahamense TaxID=73915 RepID=A0A7S0AIQ9_9DINO
MAPTPFATDHSPQLPRAQEEGAAEARNASQGKGAHVFFVLDRSGSISAIAEEVVKGFNDFVAEQRSQPGRMRMTLLQFNAEDPHEVVFESRDIKDVPLLTLTTFQPRGGTPLYDALGHALTEAEKSHVDDERIVMVTFTDGLENASREHSRNSIFERIADKRKAGWAFVFLGANQDSYGAGGSLGYGSSNIQNFAFDGEGTKAAFGSVSEAVTRMKYHMMHNREAYDSEDFFEGVKLAEADYQSRGQ